MKKKIIIAVVVVVLCIVGFLVVKSVKKSSAPKVEIKVTEVVKTATPEVAQ